MDLEMNKLRKLELEVAKLKDVIIDLQQQVLRLQPIFVPQIQTIIGTAPSANPPTIPQWPKWPPYYPYIGDSPYYDYPTVTSGNQDVLVKNESQSQRPYPFLSAMRQSQQNNQQQDLQ